MGIVLDKLDEKNILISDGGWGTMLQAKGLPAGACPEEWNFSNPDAVREVAAAYAAAGSDMVLTNTFGGSVVKLSKQGFGDRVEAFNEAGAKLSVEGAPEAVVAGSVGPTGEFLAPLGSMSEAEMQDVFAEQIAAMVKGGLRAICVESFSAVEEICCAVRAAKEIDDSLDVLATMTFDSTPKGFRTMMGVDVARAVEALSEAGADVLGSNCGNGIENMVLLAKEFRGYTDKPILIHANAGVPELVDGETVFRQGPEEFAANAPALVEAGANIIGGCCGTTPQHIAAMREAVASLRA
jgi:5-methyltetrahydrofolate--homocysteine methyltransferase